MRLDTIFITDLQIETIIGVYDWERHTPQTVAIDLEMAADIGAAVRTDDIRHTVDYKAVAKRLIAYVGESRFELVETLVERVAGIVRDEFGVPWVRVRLRKPGAVRGARDVGIVIERGRR